MRQVSVVSRDSNNCYNYYCRQCGYIVTQAEWPEHCPNCGNTEDIEGWGVSGDAGTSNTTVTKARVCGPFTAVGTIDKRRR